MSTPPPLLLLIDHKFALPTRRCGGGRYCSSVGKSSVVVFLLMPLWSSAVNCWHCCCWACGLSHDKTYHAYLYITQHFCCPYLPYMLCERPVQPPCPLPLLLRRGGASRSVAPGNPNASFHRNPRERQDLGLGSRRHVLISERGEYIFGGRPGQGYLVVRSLLGKLL